MAAPSGQNPLDVDAHWDRVLDLTARRVAYGTAAGLVMGLLFARAPAGRNRAISFGAGMGFGSAYTDAAREFGQAVPPLPKLLGPAKYE